MAGDPVNIVELYERRAAEWSDVQSHLPLLRDLAAQCDHVTEFGTRHGYSTTAFLAGLPTDGRLVSYDIDPGCGALFDDPRWTFRCADTGTLEAIDPTDLLLVDTLHTAEHVTNEIRHADAARRFVVFHDTVLFGSADETTGQPPGIMHAILEWMADNTHWRVLSHSYESCGLLVLERR